MGGFFKNKYFVALLTLFILLAGVPTILSAMGQRDFVRDVSMSVMTPFLRGATALGNALRGYVDYFTEYDRLSAENEQLRAAVETLTRERADAALFKKENEWMRSYLGIKRTHTDFVFCDANRIGASSGKYMTSMTLDRGSAHGIEVGMPVTTASGVVGKVTEVGLTFCRVSTILNYDSAVGAYVERSGAVGLVCGNFERKEDGTCELRYIRFDADIEVGDRVLSSGLGSVYPRGLVLGTVEELSGDPYDHTRIAVIRPAADLSDLERVMILTAFTVAEDAS